MLDSMKYKILHIRLHYATIARLNDLKDDLEATTYAEVVRHLLQHWERHADINPIQISAPAQDTK